MRNLLIKYLALSYDSKMFGTTFRHLRVVNVLMPLFCFAGLFNLLTPGFDFVQFAMFIPFISVWLIWLFYFKAYPPRMPELDWEQEFQYASARFNDNPNIRHLRERWTAKYRGREKFVEVTRFLIPWICIILTAIIYLIFAIDEPGYSPSRFF